MVAIQWHEWELHGGSCKGRSWLLRGRMDVVKLHGEPQQKPCGETWWNLQGLDRILPSLQGSMRMQVSVGVRYLSSPKVPRDVQGSHPGCH